MALTIASLGIIKNILDSLGEPAVQPRRIMSLGYPDILAGPHHIMEIFGNEIANNLRLRPDGDAIVRWHGIAKLTDKIVESHHFFSLLGFELDIVDIVKARGDEIILDLNEPCPTELYERYALVIDSGTCEHCFNIGQAARNLAAMVASGGYIFQGNPINMFNHGFYNLNPTWYYDFYMENGFSIELMRVVQNAVSAPTFFEVPAYQRFTGIPENCGIIVVARRRDVRPLKWPIQTKYKNNPTLRG